MNKQLLGLLAILVVLATAMVAGKIGYERGFDACIEENNLYNRYKENE